LAPFFLFIVRHPKVVFVEYSPKQKLTKSLTHQHDIHHNDLIITSYSTITINTTPK
jgi:hypothetical protein